MQTLQQIRRIRKKNGLPGRRRVCKKREEKTGAGISHSYGFLKQRFGPVLDIENHDAETSHLVETAFYHSLKNLALLYRFEPLLYPPLPYPLNIRKSFKHAQPFVEKKGSHIQLIISQGYKSLPALCTVRELDINLSLYYIPIDALWKLHLSRNKPAFNLLLSIFAFLSQDVGMPLFNDSNYVDSTCDNIFEMIEEDNNGYDDDELKEYRTLGTTIKRVAPILNKEIAYSRNLDQFESRVNSFEPKSDFDNNLLDSAKAFLELKCRFPGRSFMENLSCGFLYFDLDEMTSADQYFSFCWTIDGWLIENLESYVNSDLQERSYLDQPCSVQHFSKKHRKETHDFGFHNTLLEQLNLLTDTITTIP